MEAIVQVILASVAGIIINKFVHEMPLVFGVGLQVIATIV